MNDCQTAESGKQLREVLDFLHKVLGYVPAGKVPTQAILLEQIVRVFGATGAGLAGPLDGIPIVEQRVPDSAGESRLPWENQPQCLQPVQSEPQKAHSLQGMDRNYCLAAVPAKTRRLLWLEGDVDRRWSADEQQALVLTARVLGVVLQGEPANRFFPGLDQAQLKHRLHDAGTISARVAHAFDNIMTGILGFAELSLTQTEASSPNRQFLEEVVQAAQQGILLTRQLHFFSRCSVPTRGPATLAYVISEEQARIESLLPAGMSLKVDLPADLPDVAMDAELLRQVLGHLLDNAKEAVTEAGRVHLSASSVTLDPQATGDLLGQPVAGPCIEVIVTDTGPEMSADVRERLFQEPFFTTKPRHRGLGLAIVYRILMAHRGCFRLRSDSQETAVHVYLPLASP